MKNIIPAVLLSFFLFNCSSTKSDSNTENDSSLPTDGLMIYYPFNGNANDSSGHNMHGELIGPTLTKDRNGKIDNAFFFDGTGDFIRVRNKPILDFANSLSISLWAKGVAFGTKSICGLVSKGPIIPYGIGLDDGDRVIFKIVESGNWYEALATNMTIDSKKWHHYVGVFETENSVRLYIDGEEVISNHSSIPGTIDISDFDLWIGARSHTEAPYTPRYFFKGKIDEVRIYNRALTLDEIQSLFRLYE